jgi:hypothetical protein
MRTIITEAEAFIKAVTPKEEEPVRPDYSGKWLMDVLGWQEITLNQWLDNGGLADRFFAPRKATEPVPNVPEGSISAFVEDKPHSQMTAEQEAASRHQSAAYSVGATQVEGAEGKGSSDGPFTSTTSQDHGGGEGKANPAEDQRAANPTVETSTGSTGETAPSPLVVGANDASTEGNNPDPFASKTTIQSDPASSTGVEVKESAPTADFDSELWAIPSRASHQSG